MAYIGNQLSVIASTLAQFGATEGQFGLFYYAHASDSLATVLGANYISDGQIRGMPLGSLVNVNLNGILYELQVIALQSGGNGVSLGWINNGATNSQPAAKYVTAALQSAAIPAASMTGADFVVFDNTGTTPGTLTTDTAANIIAASPGWQIGQSYMLRIRNDSGSANTATIAGGTGVTVTGTATIAQYVARDFIVTYTSAGAVTLQNVGDSAAAT